jgi:UDP-GlcNAc3NAcA epimerase
LVRKLATIIGARPQFIKAAMVSRALAAREDIHEVIVHTGQHYDDEMSRVFLEQLSINEPDYNLGIGAGSHGAMTGRQLEKVEEVLLHEQPDMVLVYGDTNSTLAGALAAAKLHIPVAHVEAGLRSFNRRMPEEINRVLTDHMSTLLFAPTATAADNLVAEGIDAAMIHLVGDVMYDAALFYRPRAAEPVCFGRLPVRTGEYVLCTIHRAENTDDPARLAGIFRGLAESGLPIVLPLHPRTRGKLQDSRIRIPENLHLTDPVGYLEMIWLEMNCRAVATDSGGVQKEAYFHGKPCVTLRDETEWVELADLGANTLVGADASMIATSLRASKPDIPRKELYGSGDSASRLVEIL